MIIKIFKQYHSISIVFVPIALLVCGLSGIFYPPDPKFSHTMPLYALVDKLLKDSPLLRVVVAQGMLLLQSLLVYRIVMRNELLKRAGYFPSVIYILLMSAQPEMLTIHPLLLSNFALLIFLDKLLSVFNKEVAYKEMFDTGFALSVATLFYLPTTLFLIALGIGLILLRPFIWREWVIALIGFILPWLFLLFVYFWNEQTDILEYEILYYTRVVPQKSFSFLAFSVAEYFQIGILVILFIGSMNKVYNIIPIASIQLRTNVWLLLYVFLIAGGSILFAPQYSIFYMSSCAIPASIFFSIYLFNIHKQLIAEILFYLLIISVLFNQWEKIFFHFFK
ncbi:MAG: DUF6427 family protein [Candidatus Calescibacterium sp.]|nr:DUF6427 family protein [Candidatus Calescibacterium sp.]